MKRLFLLVCSLALCSSPLWAIPANTPPKLPDPANCADGLPSSKFSEKSLYNLNSTWTTDSGQELKLSALHGRLQVMALFFTSCQHSCPLIVNDMKAIEKALPAKLRGKVDFLLVSIDPDRDTLAALRAFRQQHGLAADWRILRGSPEDVKRLADLVGFSYYPGSQLQFAHSLLITELNPTGDIIFQQSGSGAPPREAVAALVRQARKWAK